MVELSIDFDVFKKRLLTLHSEYKNYENSPNSLLFVLGSSNTENPYQKTSILHNWLLSYEFPSTIIAVLPDKVVIITSAAKAKHLEKAVELFSNEPIKLELWERNSKDPEHNKKLFEDVIDAIQKAGKSVGAPEKNVYQGKFMLEWTPLWEEAVKKYELNVVDISAGLSKTWEIKDDNEKALLAVASKSSDKFMDSLADEMVRAVDEELKITNAKLSDKIENKIDDDSFLKKIAPEVSKLCPKDHSFNLDLLDWTYSPIIQSGEKFDLRVSARSTNDKLDGNGSILASCGIRYNNYCSNVTRTFLIDPSEEMVRNYEFVLELQKEIVTNKLKVGSTPKQVYDSVVEFVQKVRPDLVGNLTKNLGSIIGLEFRDSSFVLNAKNDTRKVQPGDCFNISFGFNNLKDSKTNKNYAVQLSDTILLSSQENAEPQYLTSCARSASQVSFYFNNEEDEAESKKARKPTKPEPNSKILKTKLRGEARGDSQETQKEQIRKENQRKLHEKLQKDGLLRFSAADANGSGNEQRQYFKKYDLMFGIRKFLQTSAI